MNTTAIASLTTFIPSQLKTNTVCLLKTAIATVVNGKIQAEAHILFDEGSQQSFLSEKLAHMLEVVSQRSKHINLAFFASAKPFLRRLDNVIINLKTPGGDF